MKNVILLLVLLISVQSLAQFGSPGGYGSPKFTSQIPKKTESTMSLGVISSSHALRQSETGITGLYALNDLDMIQGAFALTSSDPANYSLSGSFKHSVIGDVAEGFHIGGGLGFGKYVNSANADKTFVHVNGIVGFHFELAKRVLAHVDAGLTVANSDSKTQILIGGHSSLFGLSLLYRL